MSSEVKNVVGAARREAMRMLQARTDDSRYTVIAEFEFEIQSERTVVVVVERVAAGPSPAITDITTEFGLTRREAEVASALAERKSSEEIARALGISPHTVRRHAERVLDKLGVRSRRDVAAVLRRSRTTRG